MKGSWEAARRCGCLHAAGCCGSKKWRKEVALSVAKGDTSIFFGKLGVLRRKPLWRKDGENKTHVTESYLSWSCTVLSPWNQLQRHVSVLETGPSKAGKSQGCRAGHLGTLRDAGWGASLQGTDGCKASAWEAQDHTCVKWWIAHGVFYSKWLL